MSKDATKPPTKYSDEWVAEVERASSARFILEKYEVVSSSPGYPLMKCSWDHWRMFAECAKKLADHYIEDRKSHPQASSQPPSC